MKLKFVILALISFLLCNYCLSMVEPEWEPTVEPSTVVYFRMLEPGFSVLEVKADSTLESYAIGPAMLNKPNISVGKWKWEETEILKVILVQESKYDPVSTWDGYIYLDSDAASWYFFKTLDEAREERESQRYESKNEYTEKVQAFKEKYKI